MICSLIGSFLLVYVAVITFMNILGYPLGEFMIMRKTTHFSLKKIYAISFILQLITITTKFCSINLSSFCYHTYFYNL